MYIDVSKWFLLSFDMKIEILHWTGSIIVCSIVSWTSHIDYIKEHTEISECICIYFCKLLIYIVLGNSDQVSMRWHEYESTFECFVQFICCFQTQNFSQYIIVLLVNKHHRNKAVYGLKIYVLIRQYRLFLITIQ